MRWPAAVPVAVDLAAPCRWCRRVTASASNSIRPCSWGRRLTSRSRWRADAASIVTVGPDRKTADQGRHSDRPGSTRHGRLDTRAILREKTLLGETYVGLSFGNPKGPMLPDGARLPQAQVTPTVQLDQILGTFDPRTRAAFRTWMRDDGIAFTNRGQDFNDAIAELFPFASNVDDVLSVLRRDSSATTTLLSDGGDVLSAISHNPAQLQGLITNANKVFSITAARDSELAAGQGVPWISGQHASTVASPKAFASQTSLHWSTSSSLPPSSSPRRWICGQAGAEPRGGDGRTWSTDGRPRRLGSRHLRRSSWCPRAQGLGRGQVALYRAHALSRAAGADLRLPRLLSQRAGGVLRQLGGFNSRVVAELQQHEAHPCTHAPHHPRRFVRGADLHSDSVPYSKPPATPFHEVPGGASSLTGTTNSLGTALDVFGTYLCTAAQATHPLPSIPTASGNCYVSEPN